MIEFWSQEQEALCPPRSMSVSEWANQNIVLLPESAREPGPYRWQRTPYAKGVMDLYKHPDIRHIVLKWATQLGKSVALYNVLGYIIDQDPYSTLLIYPTDEEGRTVSRTRLQPLIESSACLREKKPSDVKRFQYTEMPFPGMVLYVAGSNSPTPLSQKPCRNVIRDEVNKFPAQILGHGDPMDLSEERFKSFYDIRKVIDVSSPTTDVGNITRQEAMCQAVLKYFVPCPHCNRLQTLEWGRIKFDYQKDLPRVQRIHQAKKTARYQCLFCEELIGDSEKEWMLSLESGAGWRDITVDEPRHSPDPLADLFDQFQAQGVKLESVAFRLSSIYSPWLRWGDIVGKFLSANLAEIRRYDKLRAFRTDWLGEEWKDVIQEKTETQILKLRCELPPHVVPKDAVALTVGVDCQKSGFYFVVRAWAKDYTSWLIRYGYLMTWEDIHKLIFEDSYEVQGEDRRMQPWRAAIDTGGGADEDRSMTARAYQFISQTGAGGLFGIKGASREMDTKMRMTLIDKMPGTKNSMLPSGGIRLWLLDTAYFKDVFHSRLQVKAGDPGCIYLHAETAADYAKQITAEEKRRDTKGQYAWHQIRRDNHYLDAEIYGMAMVDPACFRGLSKFRDKKTDVDANGPGPTQPPRTNRWLDGDWRKRW